MAKDKTNRKAAATQAQAAQAPAAPLSPTSKRSDILHALCPILLLVAALIGAALMLLHSESEVLFKSQEMSLWIPGDQYYNQLTVYPGGWLSWVGCYMTQFFYHPAMGVTLLVVAWAAIMALLASLYRLRGWKLLLTSMVPMMLLAALTQTGYWVYYQKLPGHMWVPTLGVLFNLLAAFLYKALRDNVFVIIKMEHGQPVKTRLTDISCIVRYVAGLVWMVLFGWYGYQLMGAWSFLGLALMASLSAQSILGSVTNTGNRKEHMLQLLPVCLAALLVFLVPKIAYSQVFEQTKITEIYSAGMPCFQYMKANVVVYRWAYYLLALSFVPIVVASALSDRTLPRPARIVLSCLAALWLAYGAYFTAGRWNRDKNFHLEIAMTNAVNRLDWEGALTSINELRGDTIEPTRAMVMMKNLALFRLGRFGNEFLLYPEGSRLQNIDEWYKYGESMYDIPSSTDTIADPEAREAAKAEYKWNIRLSQIAGKLAYYNYGKLNYCYRWCMEDAVEFGWHVDGIKMMALCCMLKGEDEAAHKFFDILKQTRYHGEWARHYETFIGKPDAIKNQPEFQPICYLKEYSNRLDGDNTLIELYLLKTFANGRGVDPVYQEMTLNSALLMKDIGLFWPRFMQYAEMHKSEPGFHMPRYYQEAAYLYGHLENNVDISTMPFDQSVKDTYQRFMDFNGLPSIAPLSEEAKAREFKPQFGNTFYYFYFLVRNQKTN